MSRDPRVSANPGCENIALDSVNGQFILSKQKSPCLEGWSRTKNAMLTRQTAPNAAENGTTSSLEASSLERADSQLVQTLGTSPLVEELIESRDEFQQQLDFERARHKRLEQQLEQKPKGVEFLSTMRQAPWKSGAFGYVSRAQQKLLDQNERLTKALAEALDDEAPRAEEIAELAQRKRQVEENSVIQRFVDRIKEMKKEISEMRNCALELRLQKIRDDDGCRNAVNVSDEESFFA